MYPDLFVDDHFEAGNDYVIKLPYGFIKGLDKFSGQYRGFPPSFIASVSWVQESSNIQPGLLDRTKSGRHCSKSHAMVITNSKAIRGNFSHGCWVDTILVLVAHVGSFESVHMGYGAKFHPTCIDSGSASGVESIKKI